MVHEDPGVVDQHVDAPERGRGLLDHAPRVGGIGDVGLDDGVALSRQFGTDPFGQVGGAAVMDRDAVAGGGEGHRDRPSDPARRAGNEDCSLTHRGRLSSLSSGHGSWPRVRTATSSREASSATPVPYVSTTVTPPRSMWKTARSV